MIICFNKKINTFSQIILSNISYKEQKEYLQKIILENEAYKYVDCPFCHAKNSFVKFGTYTRNVKILIENKLTVFYNIFIQRVICKSCKHTHALLPNFIVPYKQIAVFSITEIAEKTSKYSVYKISNMLDMDSQTIYRIVSLVDSFYDSFKLVNNKNLYTALEEFTRKNFINNCSFYSTFDKRLDYFQMLYWVLFMTKFQNNQSPPIKIVMANLPST